MEGLIEIRAQVLGQNVNKHITVFVVDETIAKNSTIKENIKNLIKINSIKVKKGVEPKALVNPETIYGLFGRIHSLVASKQALKHLGYVAQVEQIVNLGGRGQESLRDRLVHLYGRFGHEIAERAELVVEFGELLSDHGAEYAHDLVLAGKRHVKEIESRLETSRNDRSTATRWAHGSHEEHVLDVFGSLLFAIVPETKVEPEANELERRLRAVYVFGWHVEIVHKVD